jgi:hypothetical protein
MVFLGDTLVVRQKTLGLDLLYFRPAKDWIDTQSGA